MSSAPEFRDKVVLVTGASAGIGRALACQLAAAGARVGALARNRAELERLRDEAGANVLPIPCDVTDPNACRRAVEGLVAATGRLDVVINNAGLSMNARFDEADLEVFRRVMDVNYFGSLYVARFAQPHLARGGGSLIFVSSVVGKRGFPTRSGYAASKFAVHALFESLRVEWRDSGIHVGIVAPGYTDTGIRERALGADGAPRHASGVTAGKVMTADDAAAAILEAAARRRREVVLTRGGKAMVWLNKLFPRLADRAAARVVG